MPEIRKATVTEIKWQRPGNPWKRVVVDDPSCRIWTGGFGDVVPGTTLEVEGEIENHAKFGQAFVVSRVLSTAKPEGASAEQWIAMRLPDIGERRARELVRRHPGDRIWSALSNPNELVQLSGITQERALKIVSTYGQYSAEAQICCYLADNHLALGLACKAYTFFRGALRETWVSDPYTLVDVPGLTFDAVDTCALSTGLDPKDPRRVRAMGREWLEQSLTKGHCFESGPKFFVKLAKASGLSVSETRAILWDSPYVTTREGAVLLTRVEFAERKVAEGLLALACDLELETVPELPEWLDDSQREAVLGLLTRGVSVLTGGPGTGKTTTLKAALEALETQGARIKLAAPTGKAAKRMSQVCERPATTIHKLLEWHPEGWRRGLDNPLEADVVVIDETSMVDIELAQALVTAISVGTRLVLVGDVDQLPPVGPGCPFADALASGVVPAYRLSKTHRQAGESWVIDNASRIIRGLEPSLATGGGFEIVKGSESDDIVSAVVELYREVGVLQVLTPEHKNGAGTIACNLAVQEALNPNSRKSFADFVKAGGYSIYVGDKVLYTRNNQEKGLVNGDMGEVVKISVERNPETGFEQLSAHVRFEGITHKAVSVDEVTGDTEHEETDVWMLSGSDLAPLTLAYAMTVHKSQGSEWDHVVVVVDTAHYSLSRRLLYTAVTRTSNRLTLVGAPEAVSRATQNTRGLERRTLLQQRLRGEIE